MAISNWIRQLLSFVLLVFLQVWIFNKIHLFGVATPLFYIYFILKLPTDTHRNWVVFLSFLMGFCIDLFDYTLGLNMLALTIAGFLRFYILKLFSPRDIPEASLPSLAVFGKGLFIRYVSAATLIHQVTLFSIESFSLFDPLMLFLRILGSFLLTMVLILTAEGINFDFLRK